jgi:CubicO group peptidase (beta-lactamase class C family)
MKKIIFLGLLVVVSNYFGLSQTLQHDSRIAAIKTEIKGYNNQNYKEMKKPWFWIGRIIISKQSLKREFASFYNKYGTAKIDTITYSSKYEYFAKLKMEKDPSLRVYLQFIFSENGKIQGMGFAYPPLIYPKSYNQKTIEPVSFSNKIDSLVLYKFKGKFNGSIMVLDNRNTVYQNHFGYANFSNKNTLNDSTLYELASCSKQFTAYAILLLARDNKLSLSDSVQKFIPNFPYKNISIENLLTHTSGLPDYQTLLAKVWDKSKFATNQDVLDALQKHKPKILFKPNKYFLYSNTGYVILSSIIEKASGLSYASYLDSNIFQPLGMSRTRVYNTLRVKNEILQNYANGYVFSKKLNRYILPDSTKEYKMVVYQDAITGDGSVNSCTKDLKIWINELYQPKLIPKIYLDSAFKNHVLSDGNYTNYGYGYFLSGGNNSERLIYHTGGWPGYLCIIMHFPDLQKDIILLSNNSYDDFTKLADYIAAEILE